MSTTPSITDRIREAAMRFEVEHGDKPDTVALGLEEMEEFRRWMAEQFPQMDWERDRVWYPGRGTFYGGMRVLAGKDAGIVAERRGLWRA